METPRGFEIESNMPKRQAAPRAEVLIQQGLTDNLNNLHKVLDKTGAQRYNIRMKSLITHNLFCNRSRDYILSGTYDECVAYAEECMSSFNRPWTYAFMILEVGQ